MNRPAITEHDVHELIRIRWSPRAFAATPVEEGELRSLLEAARWAPSCFNEQPWRFIVARQQDESAFLQLLSCLNETNQRWAKDAGVLLLAVARTHFARNEQANRHALHDVGLATAQLTVQATALGLSMHQMAGFSSERARSVYGIPDEFEPVTAIAVGHPGSPDQLPEELRQRELSERARMPQSEFAFTGSWGTPL